MGMGGGGQSIASLFVRLGADTRQFKTGMRGAEAELKGSTARMNSNARSFSNMQTMYYAAAGVALFMFVKKSADASIELNRSMANVGTLIPGNIKRLKELRGEVQRLAIETGKSSKDLSEGLYHVISAFQDSAETVEILTITAKAATAGLSTTKESLDLLSAVTKGYGDTTAKAVESAADLAFYAVKMGQTTFPELAASMRTVIPLAATLNVTQKELFASYAALTGVTGSTAAVTTQLASIMRGFMKPTVDMKRAIDELGYSSAEALITHLGLVDALRGVIGTTDQSVESVTKLYERARALPALFNLMGAGAENFDRKLAGAEHTSGMMTDALHEQTEGINELGFSMLRLKQIQQMAWEKTGGAYAWLFSWTPAGGALRLIQYLKDVRREAEQTKKAMAINPADRMDMGMLGGLAPDQEKEWLAYNKVLNAEEERITAFNQYIEQAAISARGYWDDLLNAAKYIDELNALKYGVEDWKTITVGKNKFDVPYASQENLIRATRERLEQEMSPLEKKMYMVTSEFERVPELIAISTEAMRQFKNEAAMVADLIAYDLVGAFVAAAQAGENWLSTMLNYLIRIAQQMASMWLWDKVYDWRMSKAPGGSDWKLPGESSPVGPFDSPQSSTVIIPTAPAMSMAPVLPLAPAMSTTPVLPATPAMSTTAVSSPTVNIFDNRTTIDTPVSVVQSGDTIDIYLDSALKQKLRDGTLDDTMRNVYGVSRNVVVR